MRFIIDAQLPPAFAKLLSQAGYAAEHVSEVGLEAAPDEAIWAFAVEFEATVVTKDADFAQRKIHLGSGPPIVWLRFPNTRRKDLVLWFGDMLPSVVEALERGDEIIELV